MRGDGIINARYYLSGLMFVAKLPLLFCYSCFRAMKSRGAFYARFRCAHLAASNNVARRRLFVLHFELFGERARLLRL